MQPPIAILGAGPGGLALARMLEINNIDYIVFERDETPIAIFTGGSLDIHADDGQLVLKEAGLLEKFKALARYDGQEFKSVDKDAKVIWHKKFSGQTDRPEIDRPQLRQMLLDSVPKEKIRWDCKVESVEKQVDGLMTVRFANGKQESGFKLVVGADGAWSKARALLTPAKPTFTGLYYLQTTILPTNPHYAHIRSFAGSGSYTSLSSGNAIIAQQVSNGAYNIYIGLRLPEHWTKTNAELIRSPGFRQYLIQTYFSDWSEEPLSLIRHSDGPFHSWPLYSLPLDALPWTSVEGVTLIGDAAHLAAPNGEGVNCAMFDGYRLAREIIRCGVEGLDEAVRCYEEDMFPRGKDSIQKGIDFVDMFFAADAPRAFREWTEQIPSSD
ncbi:hypothetical protein ANO11243_057050 [Dothideomycetidae sp. 11243]|nr:hypothetical protein ANO11243_057050 [fungal sp. No.11243]